MKLDVWMEALERPVGALERRSDGSMQFTYMPDTPAEGRISLSLPVRSEPYQDADCAAFFGNLLFEGRELERVKAVHKIDGNDIAGLLYHVGADCPGAVSITPEGTGPGKRPGKFPEDYEEISEKELKEIAVSLHFHGHLPKDAQDPSPVAGVQPKLALTVVDGRFYRPREGSRAPTTHILKISPHRDAYLTQQEVALLKVASDIGIDAVECEYITFEDMQTCSNIGAILTPRFDRDFDGDTIRRFHVEDFCQALGVSQELKYERNAVEGGPRFDAQHIGLLSKLTRSPAKLRLEFVKHTLFNLAVGNTDNHAKNASLIYRKSRPELAPLYDVVPVTMDNRVTHQFAFDIGSAKYAEDLKRVDLESFMSRIGFVKPKFGTKYIQIFQDVSNSITHLETLGEKDLADATAAQLEVLNSALGLELSIPPRDYFPRAEKDKTVKTGGWGTLSS